MVSSCSLKVAEHQTDTRKLNRERSPENPSVGGVARSDSGRAATGWVCPCAQPPEVPLFKRGRCFIERGAALRGRETPLSIARLINTRACIGRFKS
jgi:hypothetical protein